MRYIDADELIEFFDDYPDHIEFDVEDIKSIINEQDTADVRDNVRGEWRTTYLDHVAIGERQKILYCSVCNQCIAYPTNYCPNCGAEMEVNHDISTDTINHPIGDRGCLFVDVIRR